MAVLSLFLLTSSWNSHLTMVPWLTFLLLVSWLPFFFSFLGSLPSTAYWGLKWSSGYCLWAIISFAHEWNLHRCNQQPVWNVLQASLLTLCTRQWSAWNLAISGSLHYVCLYAQPQGRHRLFFLLLLDQVCSIAETQGLVKRTDSGYLISWVRLVWVKRVLGVTESSRAWLVWPLIAQSLT